MVETDSWDSDGLFRNRLIAIVGLAVLLRLAAVLSVHGGFEDSDNYLPLARSLASGSGFAIKGHPTAYRPPLYPILLTPLISLFGDQIDRGVAALHLLLGGGTVALTGIAARRMRLSVSRSLLAALIVAFDPTLFRLARSVMTETLAASLVAASLAAFTVPGARGLVLSGFVLGLGGLCRPSLLAGAGLCCGGYLIVGPGHFRRRIVGSLTIGLTVLGVLAPWAIRNARVFGEPIWTTTHGGYTLALANNPVYYRDVLNGPALVWAGHDQWLWWDSVNKETAGMSEPQADRYMKNKTLGFIRERPVDFARASLARLGRFWSVAPAFGVYPTPVRLGSALFTVPVWIALAFGLLRRSSWTWPTITALLQIAGLTLVHTVYWTDMRMRSPIVPAIAILAACAFFKGPERRPAAPTPHPMTDSKTPSSATSRS